MRRVSEILIALGPAGVFLLALLDSAGIPLPGGVDALLVVVAVLHPEAAWTSAGLAIAGSTLGSLFLFLLARKGGQMYMARHVASDRGARLLDWFMHYGLLTVFVSALIPIPLPLKAFVLCAGACGGRIGPFVLVFLAARIPRYLGLAWLGLKLGNESMDYIRQHLWQLVAVAVALFLLLMVLVRFAERHRRPMSEGPPLR